MKAFDIAPVHKGLRAAMADALLAIGRMDPADDCEVRDAVARLEAMLRLCEMHAAREDEAVNRRADAKRPGAMATFAVEHVEQSRAVDELRAMALSRDPRLHSRLALFVADMLRHMEREEGEGAATLRGLLSAAELDELQRGLDAGLARPEAMPMLRWMIPALAHPERVALLGGLRPVSRSAFEGALALARAHLSGRELERLEQALAQREAATVES